MERHQEGQEERLMRISVELGRLEVQRGQRSFRTCLVFVVVVMGLLVAALVGFIFYLLTTSCNQEAPTMSESTKGIRLELKRSGVKERYDIFTAPKAADYLIYGSVTFSKASSEQVTLISSMAGHTRTIKEQLSNTSEIFFSESCKLVNNMTISIRFKSDYQKSSFYIIEL